MDFDMGNLGAMLGGFQQKMAEMKERAEQARCTGTAGDGMVQVVMKGDYTVESVQIAEGAMEDRELLEDLVRAATAEALRGVREELAAGLKELTGGLPLPPGLLPF